MERRTYLNAATLSALAEPHRLRIVELLIRQPLTVGEVATRLQLRQPQASKHLRVLSEAGIVRVEAVANRRICTLRAEPFRELDEWLGTYRQLWEDRFDRLDDYLQRLGQRQDGAESQADPHTDPEDQ